MGTELYRRARVFSHKLRSVEEESTMSQTNPVRLFVTHAWEESDEYQRVFEYLESARNFYYKNTTEPQRKMPVDKESQREDLRRQIAPAEVVIVLPELHRRHSELVMFQMNFTKAADKPIVAMNFFGSKDSLPKSITDLADEVVGWDERSLVDALRRQARHEDTTRWDTIEFKLD
jgi:hypothetical protein